MHRMATGEAASAPPTFAQSISTCGKALAFGMALNPCSDPANGSEAALSFPATLAWSPGYDGG